MPSRAEPSAWQRLDHWLWCARLLRTRAACTHLVATGVVRINRQPTDKPHARLRPGDTLTLVVQDKVRILRVRALAARRGSTSDASGLYDDVSEKD